VIATLFDRKLITTAGRKAVIGRPILYKTTREFLMRFGLKDVGELPSMEEFEKLVAESFHSDLLPAESEQADVTPEPETEAVSGESASAPSEPAQSEESDLAMVEKQPADKSDSAA